jgi:hypothetical protein
MTGFTANVDTLDKVAVDELPKAAQALRASIAVLSDHAPTTRPAQVTAVNLMEREYAAFTQEIGDRQRLGCDTIDLIADALHDIAELYRRVDGQG